MPKSLQTWICPSCGKNMERDLRKAIRAQERWDKRRQQWDRRDQRIADRKASEEKAAALKQQAFEEAHKSDGERISTAAYKLIKDSGFSYRYILPIIQPLKGRALLVIAESVATLPFEESGGGMNWRDCSLRQWLNSEFLTSLPSPIQNRLVAENRECTGRNGQGIFSSTELITSERVSILGKKDLDTRGKPLHQSIEGTFWLRDELGSDKAWLGGKWPQRPYEEKFRGANVFPVMLLQIE